MSMRLLTTVASAVVSEQAPQDCAHEDGGLMQQAHLQASLQDTDVGSAANEVEGIERDWVDAQIFGVEDIVSRLGAPNFRAAVVPNPLNPCATFHSEFATNTSTFSNSISSNCSGLGWHLDMTRTPNCNTTTFPRSCFFATKQTPLELSEESGVEGLSQLEASLIELQAKVNHTYELEQVNAKLARHGLQLRQNLKRSKDWQSLEGNGKSLHDDQYIWAAKAFAKFQLAGDACKPETRAKPIGKPVDFSRCKVSWHFGENFRARCPCDVGYTDFGSLCYQDCTYHYGKDFTHDSGYFCHKPCNREGQVALRESCGIGHAMTCQHNGWDCVKSIATKVWAIADVLIAVGTLGASSAISAASKTAKTGGTFMDGVRAMRSALAGSVTSMAKNLKKSPQWPTIYRKVNGYIADHLLDSILENGATLLLLNTIPQEENSALFLLAQIVDPTGIVGLVTEFTNKKSCDDSAYFPDDFPPNKTGASSDCTGILEECRAEDLPKDVLSTEEQMAIAKEKAVKLYATVPWWAWEGQCRGWQTFRTCWYTTYDPTSNVPDWTWAEQVALGKYAEVRPFTPQQSTVEEARAACKFLAEYNQHDIEGVLAGVMYFNYFGYHFCAMLLHHDDNAGLLTGKHIDCPQKMWAWDDPKNPYMGGRDKWGRTGMNNPSLKVKLSIDHTLARNPLQKPKTYLMAPPNPNVNNDKHRHQCLINSAHWREIGYTTGNAFVDAWMHANYQL